MLAKLVCAQHKPRQQTVIPTKFVPILFEETPIGDVRMLGGKLGNSIQQKLAVGTMADLAALPYDLIERHFVDQAQWISWLAKGLDDEPIFFVAASLFFDPKLYYLRQSCLDGSKACLKSCPKGL